MTVRAYRLMEAHQRVDDELRLEARRRWPDMSRIMTLKKLKLAIKDRLAKLTQPNPELAS